MAQDLHCRCYICGDEVTGEIVLVALCETVDRVFTVHPLCAERIDDSPCILKVARV